MDEVIADEIRRLEENADEHIAAMIRKDIMKTNVEIYDPKGRVSSKDKQHETGSIGRLPIGVAIEKFR
jgi:hypothetical protein